MLRVFCADISMLSEDMSTYPVSEYRRERLAKISRELPHRQSLGAELLLNHALGTVCPNEPVPPEIIIGDNGKPYLKSGAVFFNLSHSGNKTVCAVSDCELGVDIQRTTVYAPALVRRFFAADEREYLESVPAEGADDEFTRLWVLKESLIKALGDSVTRLSTFSVLSGESMGEWQCVYSRSDGYHFALCMKNCPDILNIEAVKLL